MTLQVIKKEEANGKARYRRAWAYAMVKDVDHARCHHSQLCLKRVFCFLCWCCLPADLLMFSGTIEQDHISVLIKWFVGKIWCTAQRRR